MGYATVKAIRRMDNYAYALKWYENTKPIRGREPEVRPLGNRRDADTYSIRKNGGDVELVLYKTPVITFTPSGDVKLQIDGWSTVATHQFIWHVLGLRSFGRNKKSIVQVEGLSYVVPDTGMVVRKKADALGGWCVVSEMKSNTQYKLNRKAANNVRARYKPFTDYLSSTMRLRTDGSSGSFNITYAEYAEVFGEVEKPTWDRSSTYTTFNLETTDGALVGKDFFALIGSGEHVNFYHAALRLFLHDTNVNMNWGPTPFKEHGRITNMLSTEQALDKLILKHHAKEVLDTVEVPVGKIPHKKYADWIKGDES